MRRPSPYLMSIVLATAISMLSFGIGSAQSPSPVESAPASAVESAPASTWAQFEVGYAVFNDFLSETTNSLSTATSREETAGIWGEVLARSLDHLLWLKGLPVEACSAAGIEAYIDQTIWFTLTVAAMYHQSVATVGAPSDVDAIAEIFVEHSSASEALAAVQCL